MSAFVLKREYALSMPSSYVDIDRDEMEYVDGGSWSGTVFAKNVWGYITQKGFSRAVSYAGITYSVVMGWAKFYYTAACIYVGASVAKIAAIVGGVIASCIAVGAAAYAINYMGSKRRYY